MKKKLFYIASIGVMTIGVALTATSKNPLTFLLNASNSTATPHLYHLGFKEVKDKGKYFEEPCSKSNFFATSGLVQSVYTDNLPNEDDGAILFGSTTAANTGNYHLVNPVLPESYKITTTFMIPESVKKNTNMVIFGKTREAASGEYTCFVGGTKLYCRVQNGASLSNIHYSTTHLFSAGFTLSYDTWYTVSLELNGSNAIFTCNGDVLGSISNRLVMTEYGTDDGNTNYPLSVAGGYQFDVSTQAVYNGNWRAFCGVISDFVIDEI